MGSPADLETGLEPAQKAIDLLYRRGLLPILRELARRPARHNQLARGTGMDSKQLSRALRHALNANLVDRSVYTGHMPVRVYYQLTQHGEDLIAALGPLAAWYEEHEAAYAKPHAENGQGRIQDPAQGGPLVRASQTGRTTRRAQ